MPPAAAREKERRELGDTPRPRQEDCVPLHPLLKSYQERREE